MKIKPPVYVFAAVAVMLLTHRLFPIVRIITFPWTLLGLVSLLPGAALVFLSLRVFKRDRTDPDPFGVPAALVTSGPYRLSRNPMYLGILLMLSGIACLLGTAAPWLAIPPLGVALDLVFVRPEEKRMERTFGDAYRRYKTHVRRWIGTIHP